MRKLRLFALLILLVALVACPANTTPKPELTVTEPVTTTENANVTLQGTVKDTQGIQILTVKINDTVELDITRAIQEEAFTADIPLQKGENTIVVAALNTAGGRTEKTLKVTYTPNPSIAGHVWEDSNGNGKQDAGEPNLANRTIYLDQNDNGVLDEGETKTQTDAQGNYSFTKLPHDRYIVRQVLPLGERNILSKGLSLAGLPASQVSDVRSDAVQDNGITTQIVGGVDADIKNFPFMLALGRYSDEGFAQFCGASLISNRYVLTAAHCLAEQTLENVRVLIGSSKLSDEARVLLEVEQAIVHPQYVQTKYGYDVALLKLKERIELKDNFYTIEPVTPDLKELVAEGAMTTITGWGALYFDAPVETAPDTLRVVHSRIFNHEACRKVYAENREVGELQNFETQLCSGVPEGGVDGCQGDSGGPLLVRGAIEGKERWLLAGATSWGNGCAFEGFPGIWADISVLYPWIAANAREETGVAKIIVRDGLVDNIDFANQSTTRPFINTVPARWQTTIFQTGEKVLFRPENKPVVFEWIIFEEEGAGYAYDCKIDVKVYKTTAVTTSTVAPCKTGKNSYTFTEGFAHNVYQMDLTVKARNSAYLAQNRTAYILSASSIIAGELTKTDLVDPDYSTGKDKYNIDYYELTGLTVGKRVEIQQLGLKSPAIILYNKAERNPNEGGGSLKDGGGFNNTPIAFTVQEGVTYLVGMTTGDPGQTGNYQLVTSMGTLAPSDFGK